MFFPPCQISYRYKYHGDSRSGRQVDLIVKWYCLKRLFLLFPYFPCITFMEVLWGNQLIYKNFWSSFDLTHLYKLILFLYWKYFCMFQIVYYGTIEYVNCWGDRAPAINISCMIHFTIYVRKFDYSWFLSISALPDLKKHWCGL